MPCNCTHVCIFIAIHELPFDDKPHSHFGYCRYNDNEEDGSAFINGAPGHENTNQATKPPNMG